MKQIKKIKEIDLYGYSPEFGMWQNLYVEDKIEILTKKINDLIKTLNLLSEVKK